MTPEQFNKIESAFYKTMDELNALVDEDIIIIFSNRNNNKDDKHLMIHDVDIPAPIICGILADVISSVCAKSKEVKIPKVPYYGDN